MGNQQSSSAPEASGNENSDNNNNSAAIIAPQQKAQAAATTTTRCTHRYIREAIESNIHSGHHNQLDIYQDEDDSEQQADQHSVQFLFDYLHSYSVIDLYLDKVRFSDEGFHALLEFLASNGTSTPHSLTKCRFWISGQSQERQVQLFQVVSTNTFLTHLRLSSDLDDPCPCNLDCDILAGLLEKNNPPLQELYLSAFDFEGDAALVQRALGNIPHLTTLILSYCYFDDISHLAYGLRGNRTLQVLHFSVSPSTANYNAALLVITTLLESTQLKLLTCDFVASPHLTIIIDKEIVQHFARVLSTNKHIKTLELSQLQVPSVAAGLIFQALVQNTTLEYLMLGAIQQGDDNLQLVMESLPMMTGLKTLHLDHSSDACFDLLNHPSIVPALTQNTRLLVLFGFDLLTDPNFQEKMSQIDLILARNLDLHRNASASVIQTKLRQWILTSNLRRNASALLIQIKFRQLMARNLRRNASALLIQTKFRQLIARNLVIQTRVRQAIYADMPPLMLAEDPPPKNGIWLLAPASSSSSLPSSNSRRHDDRVVLHYVFVDHTSRQIKSVQRGIFPERSVILSASAGVCWIYAPSTIDRRSTPGVIATASSALALCTDPTNNCSWELFAVRDINVKVQLFTVAWPGAEAASVVTDGRGAAYVLLPTDPRNPSTCDCTLIRFNSQYEDGKNILQELVPCHSCLYRDRDGGVWIHVQDDYQGNNSSVANYISEDSERLTPGIWYITPFQATCVVSRVSPDAKINLDESRTGLLLLSPMVEENNGDVGAGSSSLVHLGPSGELHRRIIPVTFSNVATVLDDGNRGALVHCRNSDNRWKLYRVSWDALNDDGEVNPALMEFVAVPSHTKLVTDGKGGVWVWKRVGKRNNRAVLHFSREGERTETDESFPGSTVMEG